MVTAGYWLGVIIGGYIFSFQFSVSAAGAGLAAGVGVWLLLCYLTLPQDTHPVTRHHPPARDTGNRGQSSLEPTRASNSSLELTRTDIEINRANLELTLLDTPRHDPAPRLARLRLWRMYCVLLSWAEHCPSSPVFIVPLMTDGPGQS